MQEGIFQGRGGGSFLNVNFQKGSVFGTYLCPNTL